VNARIPVGIDMRAGGAGMNGGYAQGSRTWRLRQALRRLVLRKQHGRGRSLVALFALAAAALFTLALFSSRVRQRSAARAADAEEAEARRSAARAALATIHDVIPSPSPWPAEREDERPPPALYGTSGERCFAVGVNDAAGALWQVNSRALCYNPNPVCLYGGRLDELVSFKERGSGECVVLYTNTHTVKRASIAQMDGSCARFRMHRVMSMLSGANERHERDFHAWQRKVTSAAGAPHREFPIEWQPDLAIVVPKYDWSVNICHYNRIWQYILFVIRHLRLFVPDVTGIRDIHILFRAKADYNNSWAAGLRAFTVPVVEQETGYKITVSKIRHDSRVGHKCLRRAIFLGREGRVDAYPFLNDSEIWSKEFQIDDNHVPSIPHDSLWFRRAAYAAFGLPDVAEFADGSFKSIPIPPLRLGILQRSAKSRRRFSADSGRWFDELLERLSRRYGFELRHVRFLAGSSLASQASLVRDIGLAVGIHGANFVNTIFMPPAAALFEVFPFRYVRYYYAAGANTGLRYSFHEASSGTDYHCDADVRCFFMYRESEISLNEVDRRALEQRVDTAMRYLVRLHATFPSGRIALERRGNSYFMPEF
jgi:hypothetical protein